MIIKNKMTRETITIDKKLYEQLISNKKEIDKSLLLNHSLLDAIPHPAMLIDKNRIVLAANKKSKIMGAIVGKECYNGFSSCSEICNKGNNCCFCKKGLDLESMDAKHMEMEDDAYIWDTWWVPVDNNFFLYYSVDITDIRRGEQLLKESAKELKTSNEELEQFAYAASHDLQEPLRVVSTYCQLIDILTINNCMDVLEEEQKKELKQYVNFITDATNRMRYLIKDLLEFSRVGRANDNYEMVDMNDIMEDTKRDFAIVIKERKAVINCAEMPTLLVKKNRIRQVFHNLVSNAIKFRSSRDIVISINIEERDNDWLFSVSDTGIGIDEKQYTRVFGIFKRLHNREEYPGTGIGLALVKKIIENHGGEIWLESTLNRGSTFFFTIPKSWEMIKLEK